MARGPVLVIAPCCAVLLELPFRTRDECDPRPEVGNTESGQWSLAPAFDVTYAYNPDSTWTRQHLMGVNGKFATITRTDLMNVADRFDITEAKAIIDEIASVIARFAEFAEAADLPHASVREITQGLAQLPR